MSVTFWGLTFRPRLAILHLSNYTISDAELYCLRMEVKTWQNPWLESSGSMAE